MTLAGCSRPGAEAPAPPAAIAIRETPPAELLRCASRPVGFPVDEQATIPPAARAAAERLARAFAASAGQLDRLINWVAPGSCAGAGR
ncbi:MAG: hypothetical protein DI623_03035 [Sphingomonas sanxanigenens]|jgi:hypothetical protein|uniref:Uncharacterized protein n=1 Tax=Sphingomonas sanxanigenens TaxID=397260 RepID=A0A2W5C8R4_9SPHN|nr:MAG: hypothetical protein DI623_03035 [Sphingomonas sanxanigenens]